MFTGARVVDGTGAPWFRADVAVSGGRIAAVGLLPEPRLARATRRIDASGLILAPGFIDLLGQSEYNVLVDPRAASKVTQGITTEVTGEGDSIAPNDERMFREAEPTWKRYGVRADFFTLADYFARFAKSPPTINLGTFVGSGGLRQLVIGGENRRATAGELARMCDEVEKAMKDGALGLSSSLQYVPDIYNSTGEIVAMGSPRRRTGACTSSTSARRETRSTHPSTRSSGSPATRGSRRTSGTSRPRTSATGATCRPSSRG